MSRPTPDIASVPAHDSFAMYRKIRENLHDLDATIHACLVMGYEDIGAQLLAEEAVSRDRGALSAGRVGRPAAGAERS